MATHQFQPSRYFHTIGTHEPVSRVANGDTIVTTALDAWGADMHEVQVTERGNPMTGPFFVEEAAPGDTLAITFDDIWPARAMGFSRTVVAPNVVDPEFVPMLPPRSETKWHLDSAHGVARLAQPAAIPDAEGGALVGPSASLADRLVLPLACMLGCFGVAPARGEAISTATAGPHGGNMDYRGFCVGATAYLPVAVPGALFFLGDGHAAQGDGEIVGTGVEVAMNVKCTLRVRKGWSIAWPRGENADFIFTVGNARPLDQALQHATTEMLRWLSEDYHLSLIDASTVLGQCVAYDLGNVFDPAYTMVCKLSKRLLADLK